MTVLADLARTRQLREDRESLLADRDRADAQLYYGPGGIRVEGCNDAEEFWRTSLRLEAEQITERLAAIDAELIVVDPFRWAPAMDCDRCESFVPCVNVAGDVVCSDCLDAAWRRGTLEAA